MNSFGAKLVFRGNRTEWISKLGGGKQTDNDTSGLTAMKLKK